MVLLEWEFYDGPGCIRVERAVDGLDFTTLQEGLSMVTSYVDVTPYVGLNYYRMIYQYLDVRKASDIIAVNFTKGFELTLNTVNYGESLLISIVSDDIAQVQLHIMDLYGHLVLFQTMDIYPGRNQLWMDIRDINPGWFFIYASSPSCSLVKQFLKVK